MIVDAHHHLWDPRKRAYPWMSPEVASLRRPFTISDLRTALPSPVQQTIVVQAVSGIEETQDLLEQAAQSGGLVAGVVGWVDLASAHVTEDLSRMQSQGPAKLAGIRHQVQDEADPCWLERPDVRRGLTALAAAGLPYDLLVRTRELPSAIATVRELPQLGFVLDHGAKPDIAANVWEPWSSLMQQLAQFDNVWCKISGLVTEADWQSWTEDQIVPYIQRLLDLFGTRRLIFGSDWPVCLLAGGYERVLHLVQSALADLTPPERDAVFAKNAQQVYGLA